jgi:uncharacterized protein YrrD
MLVLGSTLLEVPIMSLQTGGKLAVTKRPIIDPSNLKIIAYEIDGTLLVENPSFVRTDDVREYGKIGMIIDSNDELIGLDDVISIKNIYSLEFNLVGMPVIDDHGKNLGKVNNYSIETGNFVIQQLNVQRGFLKGITDTGLLINRSQIVEINDNAIIVKAPSIRETTPVMQAIRGEFSNPFRNSKPQTEQSS